MDANTQGNVRRNRRLNRPRNTVLPVITGTPAVGQTLTCSNGTWTNTTGISYKHQWLNQDGSSLVNASGASTYVVAAGDSGKKIQCTVIARNAAGPGAIARTASVTIT